MNDVIRLDAIQVPSVGICSNKITPEQMEKIVTWAQQFCGGKVTLMFDNDAEGEAGVQQALFALSPHTPILRAWSSDAFDGEFANRQPESLSLVEWESICQSLTVRWAGLNVRTNVNQLI